MHRPQKWPEKTVLAVCMLAGSAGWELSTKTGRRKQLDNKSGYKVSSGQVSMSILEGEEQVGVPLIVGSWEIYHTHNSWNGGLEELSVSIVYF